MLRTTKDFYELVLKKSNVPTNETIGFQSRSVFTNVNNLPPSLFRIPSCSDENVNESPLLAEVCF